MSHDAVRAAFREAVPEIHDGLIEIKAIAGELGGHCKVALHSRDPDIDPIGASVGMGGRRILQVLRAVGGVFDLVPWNRDPLQYVTAALRPCTADLELGEPLGVRDVVYWHTEAEPPPDFAARADTHVRLAAELTGVSLVMRGTPTARQYR